MNILYVEDNELDIELTKRELSKNETPYQLTTVSTLADARNILLEANDILFDVLLVDMHLPDGEGLNLLEWVREKQLPYAVVLITGQGDEETAVASLKSGADDYISKNSGYLKRLPGVLSRAKNRFTEESTKPTSTLRILYVEDNLVDIDLTRRHISRYAPHLHLEIMNRAEELISFFSNPNGEPYPDVILLDHRLQGVNALELMKELQLKQVHIPMILVTGHGDEEVAVQALKMGAADYVVKTSDYLFHLPSVIENAHNRYKLAIEQQALKESEARFRRLAENAQDIIAVYSCVVPLGMKYISPSITTVLGYQPTEICGEESKFINIIHPDDRDLMQKLLSCKLDFNQQITFRTLHKDGRTMWMDQRCVPVYDENNKIISIESVTHDITRRKKDEQQIQRQLNRLSAMLSIENAISASLDLHLTLDIVLEQAIEQLKADATGIILLNPITHQLTPFINRGFNHDEKTAFKLKPGEGYPGQSAMERRIIYTREESDFKDPNLFSQEMISEGFRTGYWVPLITKGVVKGVMEVFSRQYLDSDREWVDYLNMLASQSAIAIDNAELFENLQKSNSELLQAYDSTLEGWVLAMDLRDKETEGHSQRVAEITVRLASRLGIRSTELEDIRRGALLHDIGKMAIPDSILLKPGPLTDEEWVVMRKHPEFAADLLRPIGYLRKAMDIPMFHHEKWDGTGYPSKLSDENIPLAARIFSVVDVWDALTSDRPYRKAWDCERTKKYLHEESGRHFDPQVIEEFLKMLDDLAQK